MKILFILYSVGWNLVYLVHLDKIRVFFCGSALFWGNYQKSGKIEMVFRFFLNKIKFRWFFHKSQILLPFFFGLPVCIESELSLMSSLLCYSPCLSCYNRLCIVTIMLKIFLVVLQISYLYLMSSLLCYNPCWSCYNHVTNLSGRVTNIYVVGVCLFSYDNRMHRSYRAGKKYIFYLDLIIRLSSISPNGRINCWL